VVDNRDSKAFFETLASDYDRTRNIPFLKAAQAALHFYLERFNSDYSRVLEVGVGTGETLTDLERSFHRVAGFDISENMVAIARDKCLSSSTALSVASAEALPYDDATFGTVISMDVLEHVQDPLTCLEEITRVLAPQGVAFVTTPSPLWAPVHWVAERTGHKVKEGPHRFVWLPSLARSLTQCQPEITVLHTGYLVYAPLPIFRQLRTAQLMAHLPLFRLLGHNQLLIFYRSGQ
jgi:ubiquinone/menaquinone biosynthesis C-methylase UbiE